MVVKIGTKKPKAAIRARGAILIANMRHSPPEAERTARRRCKRKIWVFNGGRTLAKKPGQQN